MNIILMIYMLLQPSLTVGVQGVDQAGGKMLIAVYGSSETYMDEAQMYLSRSVPVTEAGELTIALNLLEGTYAITVFHDINDDGKLNTNLFGIPTEPYGFSNNVTGKLGPPSFEKAAVSSERSRIDIRLK